MSLRKCPHCGRDPVSGWSHPHGTHITGHCRSWFGDQDHDTSKAMWDEFAQPKPQEDEEKADDVHV